MPKKLRIAINAQLAPDGPTGGTVTVLRALTALAHLEEGTEEYIFVGPHEDPEWLRPLVGPTTQVVRGPGRTESTIDRLESIKNVLGPLRRPARRLVRMIKRPQVNAISSFFDSLSCDVVHFPFQEFEPCRSPVIFNPHDLQHLHYPEFFSPEIIEHRERLYPLACLAAHTVVVASEYVKCDVVQHYGVSPEKVQVIPWAPPPLRESELSIQPDSFAMLKQKYDLPDSPFALYPAMTWEHKNHLRLLQALALLRDRDGLNLNLICSGHQTEFWPRIQQEIIGLKLEGIVKFVGLIPNDELSVLYRTAQFVFVPSLFEAVSAPIFEAWQHNAPVASSSVTSLPEQAGDAALLFNPNSVEDIADALTRMTTDPELRETLRRRGSQRLHDFSLERTARAYRAVYRRAAGQVLNEEDSWLLGSELINEPG